MAGCGKVAAHMCEATAQAEGWWQRWKGNDVADELAKDARPHLVGEPEQWVRACRSKQAKWEGFAAAVEQAALKKHLDAEWLPHLRGRGAKVASKAGLGHSPVYLAGRWV